MMRKTCDCAELFETFGKQVIIDLLHFLNQA